MGYLFEEMEPQDQFDDPPYGDKRIKVSFSGGKTSGKMCHQIVEQFGDTHDIVITFANTGAEAPETLDFVHKCEVHFGWDVVWLEAKVDPKPGKGVRHKIVDYWTASRDARPFEDVIEKYGVPNVAYPQCTTRLKTSPMDSYLRSIGWNWKTYTTCIGIRSDEFDRMSTKRKEYKFWYPLVNANWDRQAVDDWWDKQPFNLGIPEHLGNCTWCFKKTLKKLKRVARERPDDFEFPKRMEELYSNHRAPGGPRYFFRGGRTANDILASAMDEHPDDAIAGECDQGCEVFGPNFDVSDLKGD
jgi:hypothetical protein